MEIKCLKLGSLLTNCYIVINKDECLIIDPADEAKKIIEACKNYKVRAILVTHHHFDHILALEELEKYYNLEHNNHNNNGFKYEVIATPGHTSDSITFYFKDEHIMFTGDFIFYHTIGRVDLGGNINDMKSSLAKFKSYDDNIVIYPGHGTSTNLGNEKPYFDYYLN